MFHVEHHQKWPWSGLSALPILLPAHRFSPVLAEPSFRPVQLAQPRAPRLHTV